VDQSTPDHERAHWCGSWLRARSNVAAVDASEEEPEIIPQHVTGGCGERVALGRFRLRKKAERVGSVEARDQQEALEKAYAELDIPEHGRFRISAQRE
jgi:hypothetical protein